MAVRADGVGLWIAEPVERRLRREHRDQHFGGETGQAPKRRRRYAEAKEVLGGYWMIQVKSKEEAVEWAKRCPGGPNETIEVGQVQEMSDYPADVRKVAEGLGFADMQMTAKDGKPK